MKKIAVFPGTFNPFTIGHFSLVNRALTIFDEIVVAIGVNPSKQGNTEELKENIKSISELFEGKNVRVISYQTLTADLVKELNASCIIRGIRGINDYEYEKNMADVNKEVFGVETVFLFSDLNYAHVSSSLIRELKQFGKDYSDLVPQRKSI